MNNEKETQEDFGLIDSLGPKGWDKSLERPLYLPLETHIEAKKLDSLTVNVSGLKEGTKADDGKPRMDLIDSLWIEGVAKVLGFGAKKYAANNWRKGIAFSRLSAGVLRHLYAWLRGEDIDPESGLPHLHHASCGLMFLSNLAETRKDLDDRYKE